MRPVEVVGVGQTRFGKLQASSREMATEAVMGTLTDCRVRASDIEASYVGHYGLLDRQKALVGQLVLSDIGVTAGHPIPVTRVEGACSSGAIAFRQAYMGVAGGFFDVALALGVEKMTHQSTPEAMTLMAQGRDQDVEGAMGMGPTGIYGMKARLHMERYGTTEEQLAMVAAKSYHNASLNPLAHFQREMTVAEVLGSPMISPPLRRYNFCPFSDGAAAAILASSEVAKRYTDAPIRIDASVHLSGFFDDGEDLLNDTVLSQAATEAYRMAKIASGDVGLAEVHDASSIAEIIACEALGFCRKGEGGKLVQEGRTAIGGSIPVNASGGLTAKGHPVGATGLGQVFEAVKQLRGEAGKRQVERPRHVLVNTLGGMYRGEECNRVIHILSS